MTGDPPRPETAGLRAGGTPGGRWGCGLAAFFLAACLPLAGIMLVMTHGRAFWGVAGVALAPASTLGLGARALINLTVRRDTDEAPLWAVLLLAVGVLVLLWRLYVWALLPA